MHSRAFFRVAANSRVTKFEYTKISFNKMVTGSPFSDSFVGQQMEEREKSFRILFELFPSFLRLGASAARAKMYAYQ